jgi:hypothetical protein
MQGSPSFNNITAEINAAGTDRGVAVLAGSFVEGMLLSLLKRALVYDSATKVFLERSNVNALQTMAYMTGLIPKTLLDDLRKLSQIRNDFAHDVAVQSFAMPRIASLIRDMHPGQRQFVYKGPALEGIQEPIASINQLPLRIQFLFKVASITTALDQRIAEAVPKTASDWPYPFS